MSLSGLMILIAGLFLCSTKIDLVKVVSSSDAVLGHLFLLFTWMYEAVSLYEFDY